MTRRTAADPRYLAWHCTKCGDTGRLDDRADPTMADNAYARVRSCFCCDGFGAVLILASLASRAAWPKPGQGERWPERDIYPQET